MNSPSVFIKDFINNTWIYRYKSPVEESSLMIIWSFIISSYCIGGLLGSIGSGKLAMKYGKKNSLLLCDIIPLVAAVLAGCSSPARSFEMILIGRFLYGINAGLGFNLHSQYAGEIAPQKLRGFTNTSISVFVTASKMAGQIVGLREILGTEQLWPVIMSLSGFWALIQLITLPFFPESPSYLLMKGDQKGCEKALKQLWGDKDHQAAIDEMLKEKETQKGVQRITVIQLLRDPLERWQLYNLIVLATGLQLCGVNAIYFYATEVFKSAGFKETQIPYWTLGIGLCESISSILCSLVVDRLGRRVFILAGYLMMVLALGLLIVTISFQTYAIWVPYSSVCLIFLFIFSFGVGPGATTVTVIVEIFTQNTRAPALILMGFINWLGLFILAIVFPYIQARIGHFCFLIFLVIIASCAIFLYFFLPETRGKSWFETKEDFNKYNCRRKKQDVLKDNIDMFFISTRL
ncbi:hypothetical protein GDO86_001899 [Hymenochirus boettgeri]|uniref:Solute carrier family 2, facilitated glucose transporter member 5 n=1 Tax=Hymenochirus boettgeri TaxID=247094 RepID=A0A8T2KGG2_9PIPI|nr:hypothetical protein GDO86_001899 [Hymenochirus boettgeri]